MEIRTSSGRTILKWLAWIFAVCITVQIFLAGLAVFLHVDYWSGHSNFADYFSVLPFLMLVTSFIAKIPVPLRMQIVALIGMIILMYLSAVFSAQIGFLAALHPVIALFLFFRTMAIIRETNMLIKS